jgi:hypothetical protein
MIRSNSDTIGLVESRRESCDHPSTIYLYNAVVQLIGHIGDQAVGRYPYREIQTGRAATSSPNSAPTNSTYKRAYSTLDSSNCMVTLIHHNKGTIGSDRHTGWLPELRCVLHPISESSAATRKRRHLTKWAYGNCYRQGCIRCHTVGRLDREGIATGSNRHTGKHSGGRKHQPGGKQQGINNAEGHRRRDTRSKERL